MKRLSIFYLIILATSLLALGNLFSARCSDPWDRIIVPPGVYYGTWSINDTTKLIGYGAVIDANGSNVGIKITAHCGVYLEGFTIMNAIASGNVPAPEDTYELSPLMDGSGIFCGADGGIWIRNVTIVNCTIGVGFINSSPCTSIANSTIRNCGTGVKLSNARGVEITNCGIIDCHVGIQVGTEAAPNIGAFMTLFDSTLLDNEVGLFMYPSDAFINSHANLIRHNNFVNPTQIFLPCGTAGERNSWDSNYWSDYLGADLNNDGYGDFPYVIDALNVDYCPLIEDPPMSFPRELLFKLGDGDSRKLCLTD